MKIGGTMLQVTITNSSTQTVQYDLRAAYIAAGHPSGAVVAVTFINNGELRAGMTTGSGWPAGSSVLIINNSYIRGTGGYGGNGGVATASSLTVGADGGDGGDAIDLTINVTLDNASGYVFGGGGGGGGGGGASRLSPPGSGEGAGGGGGGGGRGYNTASGGNGGAATRDAGADGLDGSGSSYGTGGAGGYWKELIDVEGGDGGRGGDWGSNGVSGSTAPQGNYKKAGGTRGLAGYAVRLNGYTCTITAGNNSTQIKGSVA